MIIQNAFFFNIWRIPLNNWSKLQIRGTLGRFAGRPKKSGKGSIKSWTLRILKKYGSTLPPYRIKTNFVADCFNRRFSCLWYYEFLYKNFLIFVHNCPFLLLFLFLLLIATLFTNLTEKSFTAFEIEK